MNGYKLTVATLLGLVALLLMYFPTIYYVQGFVLVIVWHRIVPLLVALAWGPIYALVALVPSYIGIMDGLFWIPDGWKGLAVYGYYLFWVLGHGYCAERRRKGGGFACNIYVVQLLFSLLYAILLYESHPITRIIDPLTPLDFLQGEFSLALRRLYIIKSFINELLLVAVADALLMVPHLRRLFHLPVSFCQRYNMKMIFIAVCLSAFFATIASAACEILINQDYYFHWLLQPTERLKIVLLLSVVFGCIAGGIGIRFLERKLAADDELRRSEEKLKIAIHEIQSMNLRLEQRVKDRTRDLETFVFTVSHELKNPLRTIEGYSRFLKEDHAPEMSRDALQLVDNLRSIAADMIVLIEKLLEYATTAKRNISPERIDTHELIGSVFNELKMSCANRIIELDASNSLPDILADRILLKQVIIHILANAIKFTRGRNVAKIKVECYKVKNDYVFSFCDNGIGFDMEYAHKLFGFFQRLHARDEFEGFGIGLATVRNLVEKHGGRTWIVGKAGEGAIVFFTLPIIGRNPYV